MSQGKRIKVVLEEEDFPGIQETIRKSYFSITSSLKTINDLAVSLLQKHNLQSSCKQGLDLFVNGFYLPPLEPITIVRDEDQVR